MMYGWGMGFGGWLWMVGGLILLIGIVVLVVWGINATSRPTDQRPASGARPAPLDILRERFARGEINQDEFEQAKRVLGYDR